MEELVDWKAVFQETWMHIPTVKSIEEMLTPDFFSVIKRGKHSRWVDDFTAADFYGLLLWVSDRNFKEGNEYPTVRRRGRVQPEYLMTEYPERLTWARYMTACDLQLICWLVGSLDTGYSVDCSRLLHAIVLGIPVAHHYTVGVPIMQYLYFEALGVDPSDIPSRLVHTSFLDAWKFFTEPLPEEVRAEYDALVAQLTSPRRRYLGST